MKALQSVNSKFFSRKVYVLLFFPLFNDNICSFAIFFFQDSIYYILYPNIKIKNMQISVVFKLKKDLSLAHPSCVNTKLHEYQILLLQFLTAWAYWLAVRNLFNASSAIMSTCYALHTFLRSNEYKFVKKFNLHFLCSRSILPIVFYHACYKMFSYYMRIK
jgi:hypothetical protein